MLRLRHATRLTLDVVAYARLNRAWWVLPIVALLGVTLALGTATQSVVPIAVYTLF